MYYKVVNTVFQLLILLQKLLLKFYVKMIIFNYYINYAYCIYFIAVQLLLFIPAGAFLMVKVLFAMGCFIETR